MNCIEQLLYCIVLLCVVIAIVIKTIVLAYFIVFVVLHCISLGSVVLSWAVAYSFVYRPNSSLYRPNYQYLSTTIIVAIDYGIVLNCVVLRFI